MHTETDYLKILATEIAAKSQHELDTTIADKHLAAEADRVRKTVTGHLLHIDNFPQREIFYFNTLTKLVDICDILFDVTGLLTADVLVLLDLLSEIKKVILSEIGPVLALPKAFIALHKEEIAKALTNHLLLMDEHKVNSLLIDIAAIPFKRFMEGSEKLFWGDYIWLRGYRAKLDIIDWQHADCNSTSEALMSLLIGRNFNDDRFYVHCKNYIKERTGKILDKRNLLLEYAECEKLVMQDTQLATVAFDPYNNHIDTRLVKWINEEISFVRAHVPDEPTGKLNFQFFKYTLAFLFKLLHEQKVFGDISFRELSKQISATCTAMGANIGPDIMVKKAYVKKQVDFDMIESLLVRMLEYLRRFR